MEQWGAYLVSLNMQAIFALVLALLVGTAAGWFLHALTCRRQLRELDESWRKRLIGIERDAPAAARAPRPSPSPSSPEGFPIEDVEGIGKGFGQRLRAMDIVTTNDLLESCATAQAQQSIARRMDIEEFVVRKWVCMADLMRVSDVSGNFAELLEASSIYSVQALAQQEPETLFATMAEVNEKEHRSLAVPKPSTVAKWVEEAKGLPAKIE